MKECHYNDIAAWAPCEMDGVSCKNCGYYWDEEELQTDEAEAYEDWYAEACDDIDRDCWQHIEKTIGMSITYDEYKAVDATIDACSLEYGEEMKDKWLRIVGRVREGEQSDAGTNELMLVVGEGSWIYFKTDKTNAADAVAEFERVCADAGINTDNLVVKEAVLRNAKQEDIDRWNA